MKRIFAILIGLTLIFALGACASKAPVDLLDFCENVLENVSFEETPQAIPDAAALAYYGLSETDVSDFAVYMTSGGFVDELSVWRTSNTDAVRARVEARIEDQRGTYADYRPEQLPKLDGAVVIVKDDLVICCITSDAENARRVINDYLK